MPPSVNYVRPTRSEDWEPYRAVFEELYKTQKLKDVMDTMERADGTFVIANKDVIADGMFEQEMGCKWFAQNKAITPPVHGFTRIAATPRKPAKNVWRSHVWPYFHPVE
ncbi:hypothetical protein OOU_Y34scaffold00700g2 [Pyricularia oryzae Y34]|uniref:Clr5 domain-containing protein n=2 Tax=Pyricularia oryzae TaxID=318829 RepID=A0AA97NSJ2_PYRO3|nr:uncharacterized protein PpBr36_11319 [Pyricularia pennisetigena]ELQ35589.1 hypothetical protein OOU_Y34scaffold00700g2 [Pyricularia oryzae Y34]TLS20327.1 hypothetical protein PpBr36_11319 [Pyricularia pennisetigena]